MDINLDELIKEDKEKFRNRNHKHRHRNDNHRDYNYRNRYHDRDDRYRHREPRLVLNISNLHYSVTKEQLQEICEKYGRVKNCRIEWDKMGRSNEKATVQYFNRADSQNALQNLKEVSFEQQKIQVELIQEDNMPSRRHDIRKNHGNRFRQHSKNFKTGNHWYK